MFKIIVLILIFFFCFVNVLLSGIGRLVKVVIVVWGRYNDGFVSSLNMFSEVDKLRFMLKMLRGWFLEVIVNMLLRVCVKNFWDDIEGEFGLY